jgi:hypothetical protein
MHDRSGSPRIDRGLLRESRADCSGELDFIGSYEQRRSERGWHRSDELPALAPLYELESRLQGRLESREESRGGG